MIEALNRVSFFRAPEMSLRAGPMRQGRTRLGQRLEGPFYFGHGLIGFTTASEKRTKGAASGAGLVDVIRSEPGHEWHDHGEVCDRLGQHELGSVFLNSDEREATRRMTWTLIHNPDARAMLLSGLTQRRDAFLAEEEAREKIL